MWDQITSAHSEECWFSALTRNNLGIIENGKLCFNIGTEFLFVENTKQMLTVV